MKILVPNNNHKERTYIINILFQEFLGLKIILEFKNVEDWIIQFDDKEVVFKDSFFNSFKVEKSYLKEENIPKEINYVKNKFTKESDIPILFGSKFLTVQEKSIICGVDIFAASFFMLTRWEEYVNKKRDRLNRFSARDSIAYKNNFLDRPIVNEYLEMLWTMLVSLNFKKEKKERSYKLHVSHDVDFLLLRETPFKIIIKTIGGDIIKRKNIKLAFSFLKEYVFSFFSKEKDPYNSFDYLMDISDKNNVKSHFFFMATGKSIYDNNYKLSNPFLKDLINKVKKRKHLIGIHPTFGAYNDEKQFTKEVAELKSELDLDVKFGREHYLRFEVPTTWQIWENNKMEWDSTMGYHDKEGFRCGVCYEFSVFNILKREKLKLKERPLILMEGTFAQYQKELSIKDVEFKIQKLVDKIRYYKGDFVFLWHNSSFNNRDWVKYQPLYEKAFGL